MEDPLSADIVAYYNEGKEADRLDWGLGRLERIRTQVLLRRYLPPPPAVLLDVDGGPGVKDTLDVTAITTASLTLIEHADGFFTPSPGTLNKRNGRRLANQNTLSPPLC